MYTLSDKSQFQAQAIKEGKHKLATEPLEIMHWITKQFRVSALDFSCETRETSKGVRQQLVHLILESAEDVKKVQATRDGTTTIAERFLDYFKSVHQNNHIDPLKSDVFPVETNPFPEIIITFRPIKKLTSEILKEMLDDEKRTILNAFESVWTLSQNVVFYNTDEQVKENLTLGISTKISDQLEQADKRFELIGSFPYRFDSKESFDRDFEGNWYYYWK